MTPTIAGGVAIAALIVSLVALALAARALRKARPESAAASRSGPVALSRPATAQPKPNGLAKQSDALPQPGSEARLRPPPHAGKGDFARLRDDVAALRLDLADALRHLAVVRYDAFGDMGGHLSWSMALLDDNGNGVVLTSINGRSDARSYAKNVREFVCESKLSPEEAEAIEYLRKEAADAS